MEYLEDIWSFSHIKRCHCTSGGRTEIQSGGAGIIGCEAAVYQREASACKGQKLGGFGPPSSPVPLPLSSCTYKTTWMHSLHHKTVHAYLNVVTITFMIIILHTYTNNNIHPLKKGKPRCWEVHLPHTTHCQASSTSLKCLLQAITIVSMWHVHIHI